MMDIGEVHENLPVRLADFVEARPDRAAQDALHQIYRLLRLAQTAHEEDASGLPVTDKIDKGMIGIEDRRGPGHPRRGDGHHHGSGRGRLGPLFVNLDKGLVDYIGDVELAPFTHPGEVGPASESPAHSQGCQGLIQVQGAGGLEAGKPDLHVPSVQPGEPLAKVFRREPSFEFQAGLDYPGVGEIPSGRKCSGSLTVVPGTALNSSKPRHLAYSRHRPSQIRS